MADVYVGRVRSAGSRLSQKRLSYRIHENLENLREIGGGDQGLMQGANDLPDTQQGGQYDWLHEHLAQR